jgi:hypothetical protein
MPFYAANDPQASVSFSAQKNPQRIPVNTLQIFWACGLVSASVSFVSQCRITQGFTG